MWTLPWVRLVYSYTVTLSSGCMYTRTRVPCACAMKTRLGRRALNLVSLCSAVSWRRPGGPGTWAAIISLASPPPLGHLYRPATWSVQDDHVQHPLYTLRRLATSFSVKCKQRSQSDDRTVQANVQTSKQTGSRLVSKNSKRKICEE